VTLLDNLELVRTGVRDSGDCPPWCEREHGDARSGFHHDGAMTIIDVANPLINGGSAKLYVNVSQHVLTDSRVQPPYVEVEDEFRTLLLLTPDECCELAQALLKGATAVQAGETPDLTDGTPELRELMARATEGAGSFSTVGLQGEPADRFRS
jgi:hypothetical protein